MLLACSGCPESRSRDRGPALGVELKPPQAALGTVGAPVPPHRDFQGDHRVRPDKPAAPNAGPPRRDAGRRRPAPALTVDHRGDRTAWTYAWRRSSPRAEQGVQSKLLKLSSRPWGRTRQIVSGDRRRLHAGIVGGKEGRAGREPDRPPSSWAWSRRRHGAGGVPRRQGRAVMFDADVPPGTKVSNAPLAAPCPAAAGPHRQGLAARLPRAAGRRLRPGGAAALADRWSPRRCSSSAPPPRSRIWPRASSARLLHRGGDLLWARGEAEVSLTWPRRRRGPRWWTSRRIRACASRRRRSG